MIIIDKISNFIGTQNTSYVLIVLTHVAFMIGLTTGAQNHKINFLYIGLERGIMNVIINYLICRYNNTQTVTDNSDFKVMILRNLLLGFVGLCYSMSLKYLQPPIVYTITSIAPIVVYILNYFKNDIQMTRKQICGVILTFLGTVLTINSNVIMYSLGHHEFVSKFHYEQVSMHTQLVVSGILFLSSVGYAYSTILMKEIKRSSVPQICLNFGYVLVFCNVILSLAYPNPEPLSIRQNIENLFILGIMLTINTMLYTKAIQISTNTGKTSMMGFSSVLMSYGISILRYHQNLNLFGVTGSILIFIGLFIVLIKETN